LRLGLAKKQVKLFFGGIIPNSRLLWTICRLTESYYVRNRHQKMKWQDLFLRSEKQNNWHTRTDQ